MKQLRLFDAEPTEKSAAHWKLYVDGASRNNPGPSGAGIYLTCENNVVEERGFYLGTKTNNQAEYLALLLGLYLAKKNMNAHDYLEVISDSQLLIRQLQGTYKVKHPELQSLYRLAKELLHEFEHSTVHVLREHNSNADRMANQGLDKRVKVPDEFLHLLARHAINF